LGFPYNISATAGASDFKFGTQLGFAEVHHKITQKKGWAWPWARGAPRMSSSSIFTQWLKLETSNLVHSLDLPRPIIKSHPYEEVGMALG